MVLGELSPRASNGLMKLPDRGRGLLRVFNDLKAKCDGRSLPEGEHVLASGARYRVERNDLAPHGVSRMALAAAVVTSGGGYLAVRLVAGPGMSRLDGYDGGCGRGPLLQLVSVA